MVRRNDAATTANETTMCTKTYLGQTLGGILKTAKVVKMQAGNTEIVVKDRKGHEHHAMLGGRHNGWGETIQDVVCLRDVYGLNATLSASPKAIAIMRSLESKIND